MTDQSDTNTPTIKETSYSEWSTRNTYENPLESYSRYIDDVKDEYLKAGQFNQEVAESLDSALFDTLQQNGIVTQENQQQSIEELNSFRSFTFEDDIKLVEEFSEDNKGFSTEESNNISDYLASVAQETELPEGLDPDSVVESVRRKKEETLNSLYEKGAINAAAYTDAQGNKVFLGGRIPDGKTAEDVILESKQYGVRAEDLINLNNFREKVEGTERSGYNPESADYNLMQYEVNDRIKASGILQSLIDEEGDLYDESVAARFEALRRDFGKKRSWDAVDTAIDNVGDALGDFGQSIKKGWNWLTFDDEEFEQVKEKQELEELMESHEENIDKTQEDLIEYLVAKTGHARDVVSSAVRDTVKAMSFEDNQGRAATLLYDEDELSENVVKTEFSGVLISQELNFKPEEFNKALVEAGLSEEEIKKQNVKRESLNESNFLSVDDILSNDDEYKDEWQKALMQGKWNRLSNNQIVEKFVEDYDPSFRVEGLATSVKHSFTTLMYGAGAVFGAEWGQDGLVNNAKEISHNRAMAGIFGVEMGFMQDLGEQAAPMIVDGLITLGAGFLTPATGGATAVGAGTYFAAKTAAKKAAKTLVGGSTKVGQAAAVKKLTNNGITKATVAKTFLNATFTNALKRKVTTDLSGKLVKESSDTVVDRILKAGTLGPDATAEQVMGAVNMFNGSIAKNLNIFSATFIPAAARSGSLTYSSIFTTITDDLNNKHKDAEGNWHSGWGEDRVRAEAHTQSVKGAFVQGATTGLITAGLGSITYKGLNFGGIENAYLKGVSLKQLKIATDRIIGRESTDAAFRKVIEGSVKTKIRESMGGSLSRGLQSVSGEAFEEGLDEFIQSITVDAFTDQNTSFRDRIEGAVMGALMGAAMGAGAPVVGGIVRNNPLTKGAAVDKDAMQQLESDILTDFNAKVNANPELVKKRKELQALAPQTAESLAQIEKDFGSESNFTPATEGLLAGKSFEDIKKLAKEFDAASSEENSVVTPEQEAASKFIANINPENLSAEAQAENAARIEEEFSDQAEAAEDAASDQEAKEMSKTLGGLKSERLKEFERELGLALAQTKAENKKRFTSESDMVVGAKVNSEIGSSKSINDILDASGKPVSAKLRNKSSLGAGHPHEKKNNSPEQTYRKRLLAINKMEERFKKATDDLRAIDSNTDRYRILERQLKNGLASKRMLEPEEANKRRELVKKDYVEEVNPSKKTVNLSEGDKLAVSKLIDKGYPVSFIEEHFEELGLRLEKTDATYLKEAADNLRTEIKKKYPVKRVERKGNFELPNTFAEKNKGRKVFINDKQQGIFNNDPESMLTLLHNGFYVPVDAAYAMADSGLNPSFRITETSEGSGEYFLSDIRIPHAGGTYSGLVRFNEVRSLLPDWGPLKKLITELDASTTTHTLNPNVLVNAPLSKIEGNNFRKVTLPALLQELDGPLANLIQQPIPKKEGQKRRKLGENEMTEDFISSAEVVLRAKLKLKIYEYSQKIEAGESVGNTPFNLAEIVAETRNSFLSRYKIRRDNARNAMASIVGTSANLSEDVKASIEAEIDNKAERYPNTKQAIPELRKYHTYDFISKHSANAKASLDTDLKLRERVVEIVNKHNFPDGDGIASNYNTDQLFRDFAKLLADGTVYTDQESAFFIYSLENSNDYDFGPDLSKSIRMLGLSFGTIHKGIRRDPEFAALVKEEIQSLLGGVELTDDQAIGFFDNLSESMSFHMADEIVDAKSRLKNLKDNKKELESLGLVGNSPESVVAVLEKIASGSPKKYAPLKEVAKLLLLDKDFILNEVDFSIISSVKKYAGGHFVGIDGRDNVTINPSRKGGRGIGETLVHEYVHAFTIAIIKRPAAARTKGQNEAISKLRRLNKLVINKAKARKEYDKHMKHATSNLQEFVAYILTSSDFQQKLLGYIPPKGEYKGGLSEFINSIVRLFGRLTGKAGLANYKAVETHVQDAMELALDLTGRGLREPETESGFRNQVTNTVSQTNSELSAMVEDGGGANVDQARLEKAADDYTSWARGYVPDELNLVVDTLSDEVAKVDERTGSIILNPRLAAIKLSQLVSDQNIDPNRRTHILASMLNEQIGQSAAIQMITDKQLADIAGAMSRADLEAVIEDTIPLDQQEQSFDRLNSPDPAVQAAEKARLATKSMVSHASKALKGETTNEQVAFLSTNPTLIPTFINFLKVLVTKLTYHKTIKDISPEMKNGVNNIIREIRAMEMGYAPAPSSITHNPRNPDEVVNILLSQAISSNTLVPEGDINKLPEVPVISEQVSSGDPDDTFADDSLIPDHLRTTGKMPEGDIGNWLDLLDVPLMELHDYDISTGEGGGFKKAMIKLFKRRGDRRVVEFFNQNKAFIRETKGLVEDFQSKFDDTLKREEARISEALGREFKFPPKLFAIASGSNMGTQLTDDQSNIVQGEFLNAVKKAETLTGSEKTAALAAAEKSKSNSILAMREDNRKQQIARRDNALEALLRQSPDLFAIVTDMRKIQDQLSKKAMDVFKGTMDPDDLKVSFHFNKGIYFTRRYRMFEDNNFSSRISDLKDDTYHEQREKGAVYFARQEALSRLDEIMADTGLNRQDARQKIEDDIVNKDPKMMSVGRQLVQEFIKSYSKSETRRKLQIKNGAAGPQIEMPDGGFDSGVLSSIIGDIKEKQNIPEPIRELLGEYKEEQGITNLGASMIHTATALSNQSFFNKIKDLGTTSKTPWLVTQQQYEADQKMPVEQQKYSDWVEIKADTGDSDLTPIKGMYVPAEVHSNLRSMFADEKDIIDEKDQHAVVRSAAENFAKKATGYSLAMKTLGSVGFYFRNMIGNALYFGPMQGYYGGNVLLAKEFAGMGSSVLQKVGLMDSGKLAEESLMVRAAKGSRAEFNFELLELKSMDVFGDELEVSAIQELLDGSKKFEDLKRDSEKVSKLLNKLKAVGSKLTEQDKLKLASLGVKSYKSVKDVNDKLLALGGRLASAADGFFKIGLYEFELGYLKRAAQAEIDNNNPTGEYAKLLDSDGNPTSAMKTKAASIVKDTAQSYSRAVPLVKVFNKSTLALVAAPYVRFAADVPRVYANGVARIFKEINDDNPEIKKRGWKRARGLMVTTAGTLATTKGTASLLFGLFDSEDEESALRAMLPDWATGNSLSVFKDSDGTFYTVDLTYLNPFAIIQDPIFRSMENLIGGKGVYETMSSLLGPEEGLIKPYMKSQILAGAVYRYIINEDEYGNDQVLDGEGLWGEFKKTGTLLSDAFLPRTAGAVADSYRIMNGDKVDKMFEGSAWGPLLKEILPIKPYQLDLDKGMKRFMSKHKSQYTANKRRIDNLLTDEGSVPLEKLADAYDDMVNLSKKQNSDYYKVVNGFIGLGIPKKDIERQAKAKGFGSLQLKMNKAGYMMRPSINKGAIDRANQSDMGKARVKYLKQHIRENYTNKRIRIN
jgi:hypothetical protein